MSSPLHILSSHQWGLGTARAVPYLRITDFLSEAGAELMLRQMIDRRAEFRARGRHAAIRPTFYRMTTALRPSVEFLRCFERIVPLLEQQFGAALKTSRIELLGQAYNDGGSFAKHSDASAGGPNWQRRLSGIYYLHARPRQFDGGGLAVYYRRGKACVVEPDHNSAVFFPRDLVHEVLPVACDSRAFEDSRFAVNVWIM